MQKIELGQQKPKEFMDEMMETVISDLNKPLKSNNISTISICALFYQINLVNFFSKNCFTYLGYKYLEKAISMSSVGCNIITAILVVLSMTIAINFVFGIGMILKKLNKKFHNFIIQKFLVINH